MNDLPSKIALALVLTAFPGLAPGLAMRAFRRMR
jgi:hypothetical protein